MNTRFGFKILIVVAVLLSTLSLWADENTKEKTDEEGLRSDFSADKLATETHLPVRRIVVFPFDVPAREAALAEKAWWKVREELTNNKRFLIASKQLMLRKDVMTPKKQIDRASAVLLGKHLDADALVITSLQERQLVMTVYSALTGGTLWSQSIPFTPSQPLSDQFENLSVKLVRDFMAQIPYQGHMILDPLIGKPIFDEGKSKKAKIEVGADSRVEKGDPVQWIAIRDSAPIYQNNENLLVIAEGTVVEAERGIVTVEIKRMKDPKLLTEKSLVRLPKEATRLRENMSLRASSTGISPEIVVAEMKTAEPEIQKHKNLATTGATLGSVLAIILLAF